jgi:hypothetical protein
MSRLSAASSLAILLTGCLTLTSATPATPANAKKYGIKSGVVTSQMEMIPQMPAGAPAGMTMGATGEITLYFDDFGARECSEVKTSMEMMGMKMVTTTRNIFKDGWAYSLNMEKKTGTKTHPCGVDDPARIDYAFMSAEFMKKWNMKKEGTEVIAGKTCDKYTFSTDDIAAMSPCAKRATKDKIGMSGSCSVWQNIGLKSEFSISSAMKTKMVATKIDEAAAVPASMFDVPAGFTVEEK